MSLDVVVSMTTWTKRINEPTLARCLFRLLEQQKTTYDYKVVLTLSTDEFGKNYKLPSVLQALLLHPRFEIIWTKENTKASKKLDPTMQKYPDVPIITLDDDILVTQDCIQKIMDEHKKYPKYIMGGLYGVSRGIMRVAYIRLFPPHSLADIPVKYFISYFNCLHDDEWNGIRAKMKGTPMRKMGCRVIENMTYGSQKERFSKVYCQFNLREALNKFFKEHPEYK